MTDLIKQARELCERAETEFWYVENSRWCCGKTIVLQLCDALEEAQENVRLMEAQRWIAIDLDSDEIPNDDGGQEDVLCYFSDGAMETFNLYRIRGWNKSDNGKTRSDKATHYMRLPDPPQKGQP